MAEATAKAIDADMASLAGPTAEELSSKLSELHEALSKATTLLEIYKITAAAQNVAKQSVQVISKDQAAAQADARRREEAAAAALALGRLPDADDGVSLALLGLQPSWGAPRAKAHAERTGVVAAALEKAPGSDSAVLRFATPDDRRRFLESHAASPLAGAGGPCRVQLPGQRPAPAPEAPSGRRLADRKRAAGGDGGGGSAKQARRDIRDAVCSWWDVPLAEQLERKAGAVKEALARVTRECRAAYGREGAPAWVGEALKRGDQCAVPLPHILRSPSLEGYRNKSEFTIGLDQAGRPAVGFLMGAFKEGFTCVADPSSCRHMSPTSLAYAALAQEFIRGRSKLPPWDKSKGSTDGRVSLAGFWRLLVVREGRHETFLPLPAAGLGLSEARLLRGVPLSELPAERWAVPVAGGGAEGEGASPAEDEGEPPAPLPDHVLLMVQVNPAVTDQATMDGELMALGSFLLEESRSKGLPLTSLWVQHHTGVANAAPADAPTAPLAGFEGPEGSGGAIWDSLCDLRFRISPQAFFQVNAGAACLLYHIAGSWAGAGPSTLLLDVCCGTGTIGISLAGRAGRVVGIDNVASAVKDAAANAEANGVANAAWVCGGAEAVIDDVIRDHASSCDDVVAIVDPPRAGLHKNVLRALLGCDKLRRLVYVACNPDSLARDAAVLCKPARRDGAGASMRPFHPVKAMALDLFPHTPHVESIMLLERARE